MELKPGYKLTEVGVIPDDWDVKQIRDVCSLINGRGFKPYEWQTVGLPIIRIQNLNGSEDFNYYSGQYNPKILIEHGQLLFAWSGSRGTSFGPHVWNGGRALLNYHTWKVVVNESRATPDFLLHALRRLTSYIEDRAHGASALVHTQKWEMEKFPIPIPPTLPEQRSIASTLSDIDELLGACDRLIAKKRDIKQAAMQQLLTGKTRLLGFGEGKGYKETKVGSIPEDWNLLKIADVVENSRLPSGLYKEQHLYGNGSKIIKIGDVFNFDYFEPNQAQRVVLSNDEISKYRAKVGDIFIALASVKLEGVGKVMLVKELDGETAFDHNVALIRVNERISPDFLLYLLKSNIIRRQVGQSATQVGTTFLKVSTILSFQLPVPIERTEQNAIATALSDMDAEIAALEQRRDKTRALKQGMMQELLTGRTRLL